MTSLLYGFEATLSNTTYDDARQRVTDELQKEGFGVVSEIDIAATLKKKLNLKFRRYLILGACNPVLAHRALEVEAQIGLLLPCNVVLQETKAGSVVVSFADPRAMFALVGNPAVASAASEADERLRRVIDALVTRDRL